jgi:hypothetical protein
MCEGEVRKHGKSTCGDSLLQMLSKARCKAERYVSKITDLDDV